MHLSDYATTGVAVLSLAVSIFVLLRDRRARRIDLLYRCYERVFDQYSQRVPLTLEQRITPEEEADETLKAQREHEKDVRSILKGN